MNVSDLGYRQDLFVLPFDHRSSFSAGLLDIRGRGPDAGELAQLEGYKLIIYDGFLQALEAGVPRDRAAILVDQALGRPVLERAADAGITICVPVEKSGQAEFDFEYGEDFGQYVEKANPAFVKALVRYNPEDDPKVNENQRRRLKVLSDYVHSAGRKFMFELLVPATGPQLEAVGQDRHAYDLSIRPKLTVAAMSELVAYGVEPDVWKLEGTEDSAAARDLVAQARSGGRSGVGIIVLGRGEDAKRVAEWLTVGAQTEGFIGFAVGRTVFWPPLVECRDGSISRDEAVSRIAATYKGFYDLFNDARAG